MARPVVAIVGRPNVGKSTLFNKLIGERVSIVDDTPGVTRDRIYGDCEWLNRHFLLIDTGGIEPKSDDIILMQMRRQAQLAIDSAEVIIFVTDLRSGVVATDEDVAAMLIKSGKPIVLCVNKCDTVGETPLEFYEFYNLGLGDPIAVSSVHGHGTGDLLDAVMQYLPEEEEEEEESNLIKVAVIGKPNVGKSSLINAISGEERAIVSNIAGTTRDATDTYISNEHGDFMFIDTAGLRRKSKVEDQIEKYSVIRAKMAVEKSSVCVIMIDALEGFKACVIKFVFVVCKSGDVGRQYFDTAGTARHIPVFTRSDMIHKRLIVVMRDNVYRGDIGVYHIGKGEVDKSVSARKRNRCHSANSGQFRDVSVVNIGKNNTYC